MAKNSGLKINRKYTSPGDPYKNIVWEKRSSKITNPDGSVVFEMNDVEIPSTWSQVATDIMVSKYFRKAGVPQVDDHGKEIKDDKSLKVIDMIPKKTNIMKEFGGGPVFGVNGIAIVAHGSSSPTAIANGISTVSWLTKKDYVNQSIKELSSIRGSING